MEKMTIAEILKAVNGSLLCGDKNTIITNISINSCEAEDDCLFVPLIGETTDAHKFIYDVLNGNASATFTQKKDLCNNKKTWILVNDTLDALQKLAAYYRSKFDIPIIGVTGSVGKTTTKEMIYSVLSQKKNVFKTPGNRNSQIGLPLSILSIEKQHEIAVLEMGMSMFGEMEKLVQIAKPTHAVITNIGLSHIGNLKTQENIFGEKLHITDFIKDKSKIYINTDDKILLNYKLKQNPESTSFSFSDKDNIFADKINIAGNNTSFLLHKNLSSHKFLINAIGKHNILNAMAATALAIDFGFNIDDIKNGVLSYSSPKMRQSIISLNSITLIDDSYNASPDSVKSALSVLNSIKPENRKIAVLADILELGDISEKTHFNLGFDVINAGVNILITIGKNAKQIACCVSQDKNIISSSFQNNTEACDYLLNIIKSGDIILIKGSRGMKTDEIVKFLCDKFQK